MSDPVMELARRVGRKVVINAQGVRMETVEFDDESLREFFRLLKKQEQDKHRSRSRPISTSSSWGNHPEGAPTLRRTGKGNA